MAKRDVYMKQLIEETLKKIETEVALPGNDRYQAVVKDLIMQGLIKLLEPKVLLKVRECDKDFIEGLTDSIASEYEEHMQKETGREYKVEFEVLQDSFIDPTTSAGKCGGVILMNAEKTITCENTLNNRLHLCYGESLPTIRQQLFPQN